MRQERFTEKALEAVQTAAELAREHGNQSVEPEHLLLALVNQDEGVARTLVERAGASVQALEPALVSTIERLPKVSGGQTYLGEALSTGASLGSVSQLSSVSAGSLSERRLRIAC